MGPTKHAEISTPSAPLLDWLNPRDFVPSRHGSSLTTWDSASGMGLYSSWLCMHSSLFFFVSSLSLIRFFFHLLRRPSSAKFGRVILLHPHHHPARHPRHQPILDFLLVDTSTFTDHHQLTIYHRRLPHQLETVPFLPRSPFSPTVINDT